MNAYKDHVQRKKPCKPSLSNVKPTLENYIRAQQAATPQCAGTNSGTMNNSTCINHNCNITHNTTNNINIHNHNNISVRPFLMEDLSHITPDQWKDFAERMASGHGNDAVLDMLCMIHCNPKAPQNMNMYFPPVMPGDSVEDTHALYLNCRTKTWKFVDRSTALRWLAEDKASQVQNHVDDRRRIFSKGTREGVDEFAKVAAANFAGESELAKQADRIMTSGGRLMLFLCGDLVQQQYTQNGRTLRREEDRRGSPRDTNDGGAVDDDYYDE